MIDIGFSIDMHDNEGDVVDSCILLHINDTFILKLNNMSELDNTIKQLQDIRKEISNNFL